MSEVTYQHIYPRDTPFSRMSLSGLTLQEFRRYHMITETHHTNNFSGLALLQESAQTFRLPPILRCVITI